MADVVKSLFDNFVHIGHRSSRWNPRMKNFLAEKKDNVWIIDLNQTVDALDKVGKFLASMKLQNKKVLFVGTKPQVSLEVGSQIAATNHFYINKKWTPGLLSNFKEIRKRIDFYLTLKSQFESGEINKYTKKEVAKFKKELEKLESSYAGVAEMRKRPDLVVVLDAVTDRIAITEANVSKIGVVAVCDANADPEGVDFVIPGNDDSTQSIRFLLENMVKSLA